MLKYVIVCVVALFAGSEAFAQCRGGSCGTRPPSQVVVVQRPAPQPAPAPQAQVQVQQSGGCANGQCGARGETVVEVRRGVFGALKTKVTVR